MILWVSEMLVLYGPPGDSSRSKWFHSFQDDPETASRTLWIVPTQRKQQWVSDMFRKVKRCFPPRLHTFDGATQLLYERLDGRAGLLAADAIPTVLESLYSRMQQPHRVFESIGSVPGPGFFAETARQIDELQRHGLTSQTLQSVPDALDGYGSIFSEVYCFYSQFLEEHRKIDIGGMQVRVSELLDTDIQVTLPWTVCVLDGFLELTPLQLDIIRSLQMFMDTTLVWPGNPATEGGLAWMITGLKVTFPDAVWRPLLSETSKETSRSFDSEFLPEQVPVCADAAFQLAGYAPDMLPGDIKEMPVQTCLRMIERDTFRDEVVAIARDICLRIEDGDLTWSDIGITFPDLHGYAPIVRRIFERYKIPVNISQSLPLTGSPVFTSVRRLLKLVNGWQRQDVLAVMGDSGITGIHPGVSRLIVRRLAEWSSEFKVVREHNRWVAMLEKIISTGSANNHDGQIASTALEIIQCLAAALHDSSKDASSVSFVTERVGSPLYWLGWLRTTLAKLKVNMNIERLQRLALQLSDSGSQHFEYTRRAYNRFVEYFDAVEPFLTTAAVPDISNDSITLAGFSDILERLLSGVDYQLTTQAGDRVQVLGLLGIRGLTFRHVYFGGLTDKAFPGHDPISPFWDPEMINTIMDKPAHAGKIAALADLIRVMDTALETLTISRPLHSKDEDLLPSPLWEHLEEMFPNAERVDDPKHAFCSRDMLINISENTLPEDIVTARVVTGMAVSGERRRGKGVWCSDLTDVSGHSRSMVASKFGSQRYFSPSTLELYLKCPRRFFFDRLLELGEPELPSEEMTALDRGALVHNVLYEFYRERLTLESTRVRPDEIDTCAARIREIASKLINEMEYTGEFIQRQYQDIVGCPELNDEGLAVRFARLEAQGAPELQPALLEWSLRNVDAPFVLKDNEANDVLISGKIDRLDRTDSDAVIWDYKTGGIPGARDIASCKSIQVGLYMLAANHLLNHPVSAGGYYQVKSKCEPIIKTALRKGNSLICNYLPPKGRSNSLDREWPEEEYLDYMERLKQVIADIVSGIRQGKFPVADDIGECRFCDFVGLCRRVRENSDVEV